jgi:hypothetical protein
VKIAFDRENIGFGMPQQAMTIESARDRMHDAERAPREDGREQVERQRRLQA